MTLADRMGNHEWGVGMGVRSGQARRQRVAERDELIVSMRRGGVSFREIAKVVGLRYQSVQYIVRREGV